GKDQARITLVLDNSKRGNRRPVQKIGKDQIFLTRVLRRDGKYWFELDNKAVTKQDVERILAKLGVDPDNMLIIMHQNMVEQFTVLSPQEKLRMVEAAVGLEAYRENVLKAQRKLTRSLSEEESINKLLESAEQTLNYWREEYAKLQEKRQLLAKRRFLEREFAWAEVNRQESTLNNMMAKREKEQQTLTQIEEEVKITEENLEKNQKHKENLKNKWKKSLENLIAMEREKAEKQSTINLCNQLLNEAKLIENSSKLKMLRVDSLNEIIEKSKQHLSLLENQIADNRSKMDILEREIEEYQTQILDNRVKLALLQYRIENLKANLAKIDEEIKHTKNQLEAAIKKAEDKGARIAVIKSPMEILEEMRIIDGHLAALSGVSDDVERMYESYSKLYLELKEKARQVAENREKALEEIKTRMQAWRTVIQKLLDRVNIEFRKIIAESQAVGEVKLINEHDIEAAGIEILVGFKGGKPVPLNAYTQSGGERTTATMSFLLALQQHVRSPFRAVDEYDVHMDPKNRELIAQTLISSVKRNSAQYLVITPSQITFAGNDVNIITVQNVEGKSIVREVR
ncbi:hypothetical protein H5T51_03075, partial [Candidatus Bathyarchaeota archaeon]|nr:hypothetical protein [Candidatus Bathyarchaeota archaeon]